MTDSNKAAGAHLVVSGPEFPIPPYTVGPVRFFTKPGAVPVAVAEVGDTSSSRACDKWAVSVNVGWVDSGCTKWLERQGYRFDRAVPPGATEVVQS